MPSAYLYTFAVSRLLAIGLLCIALAVPVEANVLRYRVQGVNEELRENIRAYLGESPQDEKSAERFLATAEERTSQALQALGVYEHSVKLSVDRSTDPWRAILELEAKAAQRYTSVSISITGEARNDEAVTALLREHAPRVDDVVHHGRYEAFKTKLQQRVRQRGYFDAELSGHRVTLDIGANTAELDMVLDSGVRYRFGELKSDSEMIDPGLLNRLRPFAPGDYYLQSKLLELRQRLMRLGYFSSVVVLPDLPSRKAPEVPLRVDITRAPRHSYELGVGYSTDTQQRVSLAWRSPLLNRFGHSQETLLRWSPVNPEARLTYSVPLDDPANDVVQLIARLENNEFGDLESLQREFQLRREQTSAGRVRGLQLRALNEQWGVFSDDFDASFLLTGVSLSSRQRSGSVIDPSGGYSRFLSAEVAGAALGSDQNLFRLYGSVTGVRRVSQNWRVVGRAEGGFLWSESRRPDELPPSLAFFAGGDNSLRGFAYQSVGREVSARSLSDESRKRVLVVGGTRLATGSIELQRYFGERWRGALFMDAGDAFVDDFETNVGVGFGVHYLSPVGALRLELANPVTRSNGSWRIHINIGAEF